MFLEDFEGAPTLALFVGENEVPILIDRSALHIAIEQWWESPNDENRLVFTFQANADRELDVIELDVDVEPSRRGHRSRKREPHDRVVASHSRRSPRIGKSRVQSYETPPKGDGGESGLAINRSKLYEPLNSGLLPSVHIGGSRRIPMKASALR